VCGQLGIGSRAVFARSGRRAAARADRAAAEAEIIIG
jgi:hypothetical protein